MKTLALLLALTLAACTSTQRQVTRSLADLGLQAAVATGKLSPGDSLLLALTLAACTSTQRQVTRSLAGLNPSQVQIHKAALGSSQTFQITSAGQLAYERNE